VYGLFRSQNLSFVTAIKSWLNTDYNEKWSFDLICYLELIQTINVPNRKCDKMAENKAV
jgi:hypothetical protein